MNNQISGVDKKEPQKWIPSRKAATEYYLNLLAGSENETYVGG